MTLLALSSMAGQAAGYSPGCGQTPIVYGILPWGFYTGPPIGETGSSLDATVESLWKQTPSPGSCVRKTAPETGQPVRSR